MILQFENYVDIGTGHFPCAVHDRDNRLRVTYLDDDGYIRCLEALPPFGQYGDLTFTNRGRCSPDTNISKPSLKRVAHYGAFGFWSSDNISGEGQDHKFVIYMMPTDISKCLIDGSITATVDSDVASLSATLLNVRGELLNRYRALVTPGTQIEIYFALGSSDSLPLGIFYVDRAGVGYPEEKVSVSARNAMGKMLKEQTVDENTEIDEGSTQANLKKLLDIAEIPAYFVADPTGNEPILAEPDEEILTVIKRTISALPDWRVGENTDGTIGIAPKWDSRWEQAGIYTFVRDRTCWSYHVTYDDADAAARVCVTSPATTEEEPPVRAYVNVGYNQWWTPPVHRTMYQTVSAGLTEEQCAEIAQTLADSLAAGGRSETFAGIFTPQLIIGDEAEVTDENGITKSVGTVTSVTHSFGKSGFHTDFTVDSGGRNGKKRLKDLIAEVKK